MLEDPGHNSNEQPFFRALLRDQNGNVIPCSDFVVSAGSNLPGFFNSPNCTGVIYKPWSSVNVDLTDYIGQQVTVEFTTGDCSQGAHYGYAYIDAVQCGQATNHITYCENDTTLTINGLGGFASYLWETGDTTQNVTINPQLYDTVTCQVTTFLGCQLTLYSYSYQLASLTAYRHHNDY